MPAEYAFALALHDRAYSVADLPELRSKVEQQWKDFKPLGKLSDSYLAKLNGIIKGKQDGAGPSLKSIHPILITISDIHDNFYTVTSIRTYVASTGNAKVTAMRVNADALVVRGSELIRLTVQRALIGSGDVGRVETDIDLWARSTAQP